MIEYLVMFGPNISSDVTICLRTCSLSACLQLKQRAVAFSRDYLRLTEVAEYQISTSAASSESVFAGRRKKKRIKSP